MRVLANGVCLANALFHQSRLNNNQIFKSRLPSVVTHAQAQLIALMQAHADCALREHANIDVKLECQDLYSKNKMLSVDHNANHLLTVPLLHSAEYASIILANTDAEIENKNFSDSAKSPLLRHSFFWNLIIFQFIFPNQN